MERIAIHSGLNGFLLLDAITEANGDRIAGVKRFADAPFHLCIEALAQLGASHVRFITDFEKHAFLLGIKQCSFASREPLTGPCQLFGILTGRASSAFSYELRAVMDDRTAMEGEFLFATVEYDGSFRKDILANHYREVFSCLRAD